MAMKLSMSKKALGVVTAVSLLFGVSAVSYAGSQTKQITAYQNPGIAITVDGQKVDLNSDEGMMYPLIYDGHSYVSARAVAEAMGGTVKWNDATQTVEITTAGSSSAPAGSKPVNDNSKPAQTPSPKQVPTTAPSTAPSTVPSSQAAGSATIKSPVAIGSTYSYREDVTYKKGEYDTYGADYSVTVNSVKPVTMEHIESLGYTTKDADPRLEYREVEMSWKVSGVTFSKGSNDSGYTYLAVFRPYIWGSKTADGSLYSLSKIDYGFDGSVEDAASEAADFKKIEDGDTGSYTATGKVYVAVVKGKETYMVIRNQTTDKDPEEALMYFKLE